MTRSLSWLAAGAVVLMLWVWWPTEERAVRARVTALVEALSPVPDEPDLQRLARFATIGSAVTPDVTVVLDSQRRVEGRDAVLVAARQLLQAHGVSRLTVETLEVSVGSGGASAAATLVLRSDGRFEEVQLRLVKPASEWLVQRAERLAALERPALAR